MKKKPRPSTERSAKAEARATRRELKRKKPPKGFNLAGLPPVPPIRFVDKRAVFTEAHWAIVEELGRYGCTSSEIASYLGIGRRTLYEPHIKDEYLRRRGRYWSASKYAIRKHQFEMARKNIVGAIWWGKQHLRQADKREVSGGGGVALDGVIPKLTDVLERLARARALQSGEGEASSTTRPEAEAPAPTQDDARAGEGEDTDEGAEG